ncbi:hypothetical protein AB0M44_28185 [Streptosporangium subroseum]|uniref:hypothetical protein n=1 Tax=Streptosporangium subroseum TaxID=106412 RepID=UPI00342CC763
MDLAKHPLIDLEQRVVGVAADHGFKLTHLVKYRCELEHPESHVVVYLNRQRALSNVIAVAVHPETDLVPLCKVPGLAVEPRLRHGSNLRRFPKRLNTGIEPITYGYSVECADLSAFGRLLHELTTGGALALSAY